MKHEAPVNLWSIPPCYLPTVYSSFSSLKCSMFALLSRQMQNTDTFPTPQKNLLPSRVETNVFHFEKGSICTEKRLFLYASLKTKNIG